MDATRVGVCSMDAIQRNLWRAGAAALCLTALAGCGQSNRSEEDRAAESAAASAPDYDVPPVYSPKYPLPATARAVTRAGDIYDILEVIPPQGPLPGGNAAQLRGIFPQPADLTELAIIESMYTVYFGDNVAPYDTASAPYITGGRINVVVPPGDAAGFVDVIFRDMTTMLDAAALYDGYEYLNTTFSIYDVVPGRGWIFGDESADVQGTYPVTNAFSQSLLGNLAGAAQYYHVYFDYLDPAGGRLAAFDATVIDPVITASDMYVRSPFGDNVELVDVTIISHNNGDFSNSEIAQLRRAYKYYAMYLTRVIPNFGPVAGLNTARLEGFLPGLATINNIYSAYARYAVYFGPNRANFVDPIGPTPVFRPSTIVSMAAKIYTTGYMYVEVPPGNGPGFVDVRIEDLEINPDRRDETTICPNCYEYRDPDGVGEWTNAEIFPNPVGKLPAGELFVRVTVTGEIEGDDNVFIVPQGGDPAVAAQRIPLEQISAGVGLSGDWEWVGTNAEEIPRVIGQLLVDGHAALYLFDEENDELIGDDTSDLTDGGVIGGLALEGRHFIIDTIPPRMRLVPLMERLRGDDFVSGDIPGDWGVIGAIGSAPLMPAGPTPTFAHPFNMTALNGFPEVPFAGNWMERGRAGSKAQVFFRASSLSNFFDDSGYDANDQPTTDLRFTLEVVFEDVDIYTMMGRARTLQDVDRFTGSDDRLVAGFQEDPVDLSGTRDEVLIPNSAQPDVLIQWDFQPTEAQSPNIDNITVNYESDLPLAEGGSSLSPALEAARTVLRGFYTIGNPAVPTTGVQVEDTGARTLMSVVFRAVDRAGDYFPRGDVTRGRHKIFTANDTSGTDAYATLQQPEIGPLNMWWLRETATRLSSTIQSSGDAVNPEFTWENTGTPATETVPDRLDGLGVQQLYSYAIYRTDPSSGTREEQRDGPYSIVGSPAGPGKWSDWSPQASLTPAQVNAIIAAGDTSLTVVTQNAWFLLVVMSCDEAGNIEVWPQDQLALSPAFAVGPLRIDSVNEAPGTEERNWERWFVPPTGEQIETRMEPFFWHDLGDNSTSPNFNGSGQFDPNEASYGDAEVIPYPSIRNFNPNAGVTIERVMGEFRMTVTSDSDLVGVVWTLTENGTEVVVPDNDIASALVVGDSVTLTLPIALNGSLGTFDRQPAFYTLQAQAYIDANDNQQFDNGEVIDSSPATVQFVVVDNVAEFIQRRKSEDSQPIQEMDRPQ